MSRMGQRGDWVEVAAETVFAELQRHQAPLVAHEGELKVISMVGVNGTGKTTTCAKLAHRLKGGLKVSWLLAIRFRRLPSTKSRFGVSASGLI